MTYPQLLQRVRMLYGGRAYGPFARYNRFGKYWTGEVHTWEGKDVLVYTSTKRCDTRDAATRNLYDELKVLGFGSSLGKKE